MLKKKLNRNHFLYWPYLYYNLFIHHKCFIKRKTYSQYGEDIFISSYFQNITNGFYVDIGCFHPIKYSNTARLYNDGWSGINIDINKTSIDLFNILRKRDKNFCVAISNENKRVTTYTDNYFSPINSINKKFFDVTSNKFSDGKHTVSQIDSYKFVDFLKKYELGINKIDFLNIDAESHDFEILQGLDFQKIDIELICVEMFSDSEKIDRNKFINFLENCGYSYLKSIGANGFFKKTKFIEIKL